MPPVVEVNGRRSDPNTTGYRDDLCERIGRSVVSVGMRGNEGVSLRFDDGAMIAVSLRDEDYRGPEALQFVGRWRAMGGVGALQINGSRGASACDEGPHCMPAEEFCL